MKQIFLFSEIENNFNIFDKFNNKNLDDTKYKELEEKAYNIFKEFTQHSKQFFKSQSCFISSSDLQGFYFPCYNALNCIAFIKGVAYIILNDQD